MTAPQDSSFDLNDFQGCNSPKRIYLILPARVGSSMVEQRPFKALVEGSSPSQPTPLPDLQTRMKSSSAGFFVSQADCEPKLTKTHSKWQVSGK